MPCLDAVKGSADVRVVLPPLGPSVEGHRTRESTHLLGVSAHCSVRRQGTGVKDRGALSVLDPLDQSAASARAQWKPAFRA